MYSPSSICGHPFRDEGHLPAPPVQPSSSVQSRCCKFWGSSSRRHPIHHPFSCSFPLLVTTRASPRLSRIISRTSLVPYFLGTQKNPLLTGSGALSRAHLSSDIANHCTKYGEKTTVRRFFYKKTKNICFHQNLKNFVVFLLYTLTTTLHGRPST